MLVETDNESSRSDVKINIDEQQEQDDEEEYEKEYTEMIQSKLPFGFHMIAGILTNIYFFITEKKRMHHLAKILYNTFVRYDREEEEEEEEDDDDDGEEEEEPQLEEKSQEIDVTEIVVI